MPPKGSKKVVAPTETKKVTKEAMEGSSKAQQEDTAKKPGPGRKAKTATILTAVDKDAAAVIPVDVSFTGTEAVSQPDKNGKHTHQLKLEASSAFIIHKTMFLPDGHEFAGYQVILVRPPKAFPFLELPVEVRAEIYKLYFAAKGTVDAPIVLDGKRSDSKAPYAKTFANGNKHRVALLAVNKEIYTEAKDIFYALTVKAENSTIFLAFLLSLNGNVLQELRQVEITQLLKTSSRNVLSSLAGATKLINLTVQQLGMSTDLEPMKLAKLFYVDAYKFLDAMMAAHGGDKLAAVDVLVFGREALTYRENNKNATKLWSGEMKRTFREGLVAKLK